jgi:DNA-binding NtrC family response regulator
VEQAKVNGAEALRGVRVMVVEDDVLLLMDLETILLGAGAEIAGLCRTVADALIAADNNGVAAAILDVRVGHETVAPVARHLASRGTPFVFYTGQVESDPELVEWTGRKILSKPARAGAIVSAVADLVNSRAGRRERDAAGVRASL